MVTKAHPTSKHQKFLTSGGHRSGFEDRIAGELDATGVDYDYEKYEIEYIKPEKKAKYTPDFVLPNGIIIETKGRFLTADRQKHLLVKAQRPDLDIRFVFSSANTKISKGSKTTYAMWCEKHEFKYATKSIPPAWLKEKSVPCELTMKKSRASPTKAT